MQTILRTLLMGLICTLFVAPFARAARQALVLGNDNYISVSKLQKAGNDATAMARELRAAGFSVQLHRDLNYRAMVRAVETFVAGINGGDEVVVFFAGHGVQIKNGAYLLPIDIEATSESEIQQTAYELNMLTEKLSDAKGAFSLVMVDACRDNPLKSKGRTVGNTRGLSAVEPAKGQMVVYSASKGQSALDRLGDKDTNPNSVFTREFIARMKRPGVRIQDLVAEVQDAVEALAAKVQHEQRPALYNETRGNFYFFGPTTVQVAPSAPLKPEPVDSAAQIEQQGWAAAHAANNEAGYSAYLQEYPQGRFAAAARIARAGLQATAQTPARPAAPPIVSTLAVSATGPVFKDCDDCPEMVVIPAGRFVMGAAPGEEESEQLPSSIRERSQPQHGVDVGRFAAGKFEVTRGQYRAFVQATGRNSTDGCVVRTGTKYEKDQAKDWRNTSFAQEDSHPVVCVSWDDAKAYAAWLSQKTGQAYRLLTEAEWEYAARAGTTTRRFWGDDADQSCAYANGSDRTTRAQVPGWDSQTANCDDRHAYTAPVGSYRVNAFGLSDVLGNVSEWTEDCWNVNYGGAPSQGSAWMTGECSRRVVRGGSWSFSPRNLRAATRNWGSSAFRNVNIGFRVARTH